MNSKTRGPVFSDRSDARNERRREVARVIAASREPEKGGDEWAYDEVCNDVGVSETHLRRCADPASIDKATIHLADAAALPLATRLAIAQWLVGEGHLVVAAPAPELADSVEAACDMMGESASLSREIASAFSDRAVSRSESARLRPKAERVAALAGGVLAVCDAADREGVIGLRVVGGGQ